MEVCNLLFVASSLDTVQVRSWAGQEGLIYDSHSCTLHNMPQQLVKAFSEQQKRVPRSLISLLRYTATSKHASVRQDVSTISSLHTCPGSAACIIGCQPFYKVPWRDFSKVKGLLYLNTIGCPAGHQWQEDGTPGQGPWASSNLHKEPPLAVPRTNAMDISKDLAERHSAECITADGECASSSSSCFCPSKGQLFFCLLYSSCPKQAGQSLDLKVSTWAFSTRFQQQETHPRCLFTLGMPMLALQVTRKLQVINPLLFCVAAGKLLITQQVCNSPGGVCYGRRSTRQQPNVVSVKRTSYCASQSAMHTLPRLSGPCGNASNLQTSAKLVLLCNASSQYMVDCQALPQAPFNLLHPVMVDQSVLRTTCTGYNLGYSRA